MEENDDEYGNLGILYSIENKITGECTCFKTRKEESEYLKVNNLSEGEYEDGILFITVPEPLLVNDLRWRFLNTNEIITIKEVVEKDTANALITIEEDINFEIWFSQLTQIYWDENGNIYSPYLIIKGKKYMLATFNLKNLTPLDNDTIRSYIEFFKQQCTGKKLKVHTREGSYYCLAYWKRDKASLKEIVEEFKTKNYDPISGTCALGNIHDLEIID